MGVARVILIIIGAVLCILGMYVFAIFDFLTYPASGIGLIMNTFVGGFLGPSFISASDIWAAMVGIEVWLFWILLILFLIACLACFLLLIGLKSRVAGAIFALFPLAVGVMFVLLFFTDILGPISASFALFFVGESIGGFLPYLVDLGAIAPTLSGVGIGSFVLIGGGTLGFIGSLLPKD